jgi:hypothetical protein
MQYVLKNFLICSKILMHHLYSKILEHSRMFWKFQEFFKFVLFGRTREISIPRFTNRRKTRYICMPIGKFSNMPFPWQCTYSHFHFYLKLFKFPNAKVQYHSLSDVCDCLYKLTYLVSGGHLPHQQCENSPSYRQSEPTLIAPGYTFIDHHLHPRKWWYYG